MATLSKFGFSGLEGYRNNNQIGTPFRGMAKAESSGRGYYDPERMQERWGDNAYRMGRFGDRQARQAMMDGGGVRRGYGAGGGQGDGGPKSLLDQLNENPLEKPIKTWYDFVKRPLNPPLSPALGDLAQLNRSTNPTALPGVAEAQARIQLNRGTLGDYGTMALQENPSGNAETHQALARIRFNHQKGIRGAMERALFGANY